MLNQFKSNFQGGSRANRFEITGIIPGGGSFTKFHVRSTQVPQLSSTTLEYSHFGRKFYYPGEKQYSTWSFSVLDDTGTGKDLWQSFHTWQNLINKHNTNESYILNSTNSYKADNWKIKHLNLNDSGNPLKQYVMHGCWPTSIDPIALNMTSNNLLNTFNVIVVYDYIELLDSNGVVITKIT